MYKANEHLIDLVKEEKKFNKMEVFQYSALRNKIEKEARKMKLNKLLPDFSPKSTEL